MEKEVPTQEAILLSSYIYSYEQILVDLFQLDLLQSVVDGNDSIAKVVIELSKEFREDLNFKDDIVQTCNIPPNLLHNFYMLRGRFISLMNIINQRNKRIVEIIKSNYHNINEVLKREIVNRTNVKCRYNEPNVMQAVNSLMVRIPLTMHNHTGFPIPIRNCSKDKPTIGVITRAVGTRLSIEMLSYIINYRLIIKRFTEFNTINDFECIDSSFIDVSLDDLVISWDKELMIKMLKLIEQFKLMIEEYNDKKNKLTVDELKTSLTQYISSSIDKEILDCHYIDCLSTLIPFYYFPIITPTEKETLVHEYGQISKQRVVDAFNQRKPEIDKILSLYSVYMKNKEQL